MRSHDPQRFWNSSICHSLVRLAFEDLTRSFVLFCLSCGICPGVKQCHSFNWKFMLSTVACIYITNYTQSFTFWQCTDINRSPFFVCFFLLPDVIHTVGPIARGNVGQSQKDDLESCYKTSLKLMKDNNLRSVVSWAFETDFINSPMWQSWRFLRQCFEILKWTIIVLKMTVQWWCCC